MGTPVSDWFFWVRVEPGPRAVPLWTVLAGVTGPQREPSPLWAADTSTNWVV